MRKNIVGGALVGALFIFTMSGDSARISPTLRRHAPIIIHQRHGTMVTSDNWSGYAVTGATGPVTDVKGSWVVPSVTCPAMGDQYAAFWVGIDGYSSNTVEQIGTDSDCVNGQATYYAWYEFYPHWSYTINTVKVQPGDMITAEVKASGKGTFTVTISDITSGGQSSVSTKMPNAAMSSAEWIAEAPYSGGVLPLADFGTVPFSQCNATIGTGAPASIGSFANNLAEITMETSSKVVKAAPTGLSGDGFSISWVSAGP